MKGRRIFTLVFLGSEVLNLVLRSDLLFGFMSCQHTLVTKATKWSRVMVLALMARGATDAKIVPVRDSSS